LLLENAITRKYTPQSSSYELLCGRVVDVEIRVKTMLRLSPAQEETLIKIHEFQVANRFASSIDDMMQELKLSRSAVQQRIDQLKKKGLITRQSGKSRTLQLTQKAIEYLQFIGKYRGNSENFPFPQKIPFWGEIAAGYLSEPAVSPEFIDFECPDPKTDFSLRVSGDSMIEAGILDGMTAIFKRVAENYEPKPGTIVAAYVEGFGTTLKRFYREGSIVILRPANPNYPDQEIDTGETSVQIQGIWRMTIA
jgi:repressor LexA